jgi:hypothetical protein
VIVTNCEVLEPFDAGQFAHAPHAPARRRANACQVRRARNAAAAMTIEMAAKS